jgi:hypothetical protein
VAKTPQFDAGTEPITITPKIHQSSIPLQYLFDLLVQRQRIVFSLIIRRTLLLFTTHPNTTKHINEPSALRPQCGLAHTYLLEGH